MPEIKHMTRNTFQQMYHKDLKKAYKDFNGIILDNSIGEIVDIQNYLSLLNKKSKIGTRILISYHNPVWEPILSLASLLSLRKKVGIQNWLNRDDLKNLLNLSGFEVISSKSRFFGITTITIARLVKHNLWKNNNYSVSIIVPARNEQGNIAKIVPSIPKFGKWQEIIFIEGNSTDQTWLAITNEKNKIMNQIPNSKKPIFKRIIKACKQMGKGKADAVWAGFEKAKGDILMIYDADRTVDARDLPKFYYALTNGQGEFANGSRLVYPMEKQAMQTLNKIGNQIFSTLFTWIFGQNFKDTLCGTKVLFKKDYLTFRKHNKKYFKIDPFGDFALIFGAIKNNLKVVEIPIRYKEREYGKTNISRFRHGLLLIRMTFIAFREFKA